MPRKKVYEMKITGPTVKINGSDIGGATAVFPLPGPVSLTPEQQMTLHRYLADEFRKITAHVNEFVSENGPNAIKEEDNGRYGEE